MKKFVFTFGMMLLAVASFAQYPITPVPFTSVKMNDSFWSPRLLASRDVTVPLAFDKCEETGRYTNFTNAAKCMANPSQEYPDASWTFTFDDTDPRLLREQAIFCRPIPRRSITVVVSTNM